MNDLFNKPPNQGSENQEKQPIRIKIAKPEDWQVYKALRLESIMSEDGKMLAMTPERIATEQSRSDSAWQSDLESSKYKKDFVLLSYSGAQVVGMSQVYEEFRETWSILSTWVKPQFRGGIGREMLNMAIKEIKKRKGKKIRVGINLKNALVIHGAESFGFKKTHEDLNSGSSIWELDLTQEEKTEVRVEVAQAVDWKKYRDLALFALATEDAKKFSGVTREIIDAEINRKEENWKNDVENIFRFVILSWDGDKAIGLGRAEKLLSAGDIWSLNSGFVKVEYRGEGIGKKLFQARIEEIKKRGGKKAILFVRKNNEIGLHMFRKMGFQEKDLSTIDFSPLLRLRAVRLGFLAMELDLTKK